MPGFEPGIHAPTSARMRGSIPGSSPGTCMTKLRAQRLYLAPSSGERSRCYIDFGSSFGQSAGTPFILEVVHLKRQRWLSTMVRPELSRHGYVHKGGRNKGDYSCRIKLTRKPLKNTR